MPPSVSPKHLPDSNAIMATQISYDGPNSGFQVGQNHGHITAQFIQSETSLNQACLQDLRTTSPHDDKDRIEKTNGGLLKDLYRWVLENEQFKQWQDLDGPSSRLLWIRGDPGKGKTMLLCGIIDELSRSTGDTANISFFFCQATDMRINDARAVLRGLIYTLVEKQPSLLSHVRSRYDQAGKTLFEDINAWSALSKIFQDILRDSTLRNTYLVIDALDECVTDLTFLLELIVQESSIHSHVKWIVSSRNWPDIEERLDTATQIMQISLELNETSVSDAVQQFIRYRVHQLAVFKKYTNDIRDTVHNHLSSNAHGTFLWVALVCQDLNRTSRRHVLKKLKEFPPGLDNLYGLMIQQVRHSEDAELCKRILAAMSIVYQPITLEELTALVEVPDDLSDDIEGLLEIIAICGSFLTFREGVIVFVHQSAKEFLLREAQIEVFLEDQEAEHLAIASRCLQIMFKTLQRNIFSVQGIGPSIKQFTKPTPNPLAPATYACVYWVDHLRIGQGSSTEDNGRCFDVGEKVDTFLRQKYLHWLEALGILGSLPEGIKAMLKLEELLQKRGDSQALLDRVQDASRFIRYYRPAIETNPLQVYSSGIIFSPTRSITKTCYQKEEPDWILNNPVVDETWSLSLQTLEGHSDMVKSIAWAPDGSRLASASYDGTTRIWDSATGQCVSTLKGHGGGLTSCAWSPDGSRLASASNDKTIRIWDPATGQSLSILKGHSASVNLITWSRDGGFLASASKDTTVRIWETATGQVVSTLKGHSNSVRVIAWSRDRSQLASASKDTTVRIWDSTTGQDISTLEGHSGSANSVAWSPDGKFLASASTDKSVRIWDSTTGQHIFTLNGHTYKVFSVTWSPDGSRLASASGDSTVRIWDSATGQSIFTLKGHRREIHSFAWSPDGSRLASASYDKTTRVWDPATGQCVSILKGHGGGLTSCAWSPDGSLLASASVDRTVRIWDSVTSQGISTDLQGHTRPVFSVSWSPDGRQLASASLDGTVRIWDLATGQNISSLEWYLGSTHSLAWSPHDGNILAVGTSRDIVIWDLATGQSVFTLEGHTDVVNSVSWSQDGSRLASASGDKTIRIWYLATGSGYGMFTLEGHRKAITSAVWSSDDNRIASASYDRTVRVWDSNTGQSIFTLEGHSREVSSVAWSPDGSRLASASFDRTIRIWDPDTGYNVSIIHSGFVGFLEFDKADSSQLHTSLGTFYLGLNDFDTSLPRGYGLSKDETWITYDGVNLLWLPAEFRPDFCSLIAITGTQLAIACSSDRVILLKLTSETGKLAVD